MAGFWTKDFSFNTGAVRRRDLGYLILTDDELTEKGAALSVFVTWHNGKWYQIQNQWGCPSVCVVQHPKEQAVAIGEMGQAYVTGQRDDHEETIADGKDKPESRGTLRCVRSIEGKAYAVGMDRQVYRRDGARRWTCIDPTMRPPDESDEVLGFEGVDGFSSKDIYAVGWEGEIWRFDGKTWDQIDSPTNAILTNVCCAGDGNVYACGRRGLLVRGRGSAWEVVDQESVKQDLWGLVWYRNTLYAATTKAVYTLEGEDLKRVRMGDELAETCYHLSSADGVLWSIGAKDVLAFDGTTWTRID